MFLLHILPLKLNALIFCKLLKNLISLPAHLLLKGATSIECEDATSLGPPCTIMSQDSDAFEIPSDEPSQGQTDTSGDISFWLLSHPLSKEERENVFATLRQHRNVSPSAKAN